MKKSYFIVFLMSLVIVSLSAELNQIKLENQTNQIKVLNSDYSGLSTIFSYNEINSFDVTTKEGDFVQLVIPEAYYIGEIGNPKLPAFKRLIEIPFGAEVVINSVNSDEEIIDLSERSIIKRIIPNQPSLSKSETIEDVPFIYNKKVYNDNSFDNHELVKIEILGTLRGARIARLTIAPVFYNPVENKIKLNNNVQVDLKFNHSDVQKTKFIKESTYSPYFEPIYAKLLNRIDRDYPSHPDLVTYPVKYLIVSDPMFESTLQPFIDWKIKKGFNVIEGYTNDIGSDATSIKAWIQGHYNSGSAEDPAPSFVIFVGDTGQVPESDTGSSSAKATDLYYGSTDGDYFPEIYYGRLSATNTTQLQAQLDKILYYEKYEFSDPSYLDNVTLIAGVDSSCNPSHGQPTINYGTDNYFNATHGFSTINKYLTSYTGCYDTVDDGVGFINYTAHGSQTSWADPSLSQAGVNSFTNVGKYPLAIGNCCLAADFGYSECFSETWMRKEDGGAVGYIGSSPSSYWDEDVYWSVGAFSHVGDGVTPTFAETTLGAYDAHYHSDYVAQDALVFIGNLAVTEAGSRVEYYWQAYNTLGDPSLLPYFTQGSENTVSFDSILPIGATTFTVSAEEGSYVAISMNGVLHGTALVDASGSVNVPITAFTSAGTADIIVTKPQYQPEITTVTVAPLAGPYLSIDSYVVSSGGDNVIEFGETVYVTTTLKNVGNDPATNVSMSVSESDSYVTLTDPNETFGTIAVGASVTRTNAYTFNVLNSIPNDYDFALDCSINCNEDSWTSSMNFTGYAPQINISDVSVSDGDNGRLDPGETADIIVSLENTGGALANNILATLSTSDSYITISDDNAMITSLSAGSTNTVTLNVSVSASAPVGHTANFSLAITADNSYTNNDGFTETIGLVLEDFESGNFSSFGWVNGGDANWTIDSSSPYEGSSSAKSGTISDSQTSELVLTADVSSAGDISFYRKVSSESSYDFLRFYIDGVEQDSWSGSVGWSQVVYTVSVGNHTFKWAYEKDSSYSSGDDCAWIDYIIFPPLGEGSPAFSMNPTSMNFGTVIVGETSSQQLTIINNGSETMNGSIVTPDHYSVTNGTKEFLLKTKDSLLYTINAGQSANFNIIYEPTTAGTHNTVVTISSNDANNPTNNLSVSGNATEPSDIAINPSSFNVTLDINSTTDETLTIANNGGSNLIYNLTIEDPTKSSGGPDSFGYSWKDSNEPDGPTYSWIDISTSGTDSTIDQDDETVGPISMGMNFNYYGNVYDEIYICSNGWLSFVSHLSNGYSNQVIPTDDDYDTMIAPFWDDLSAAASGTVYYYQDTTNERFIVSYYNLGRYSGDGDYTFQIIFNSDDSIVYQYQAMSGTLDSATIGIENQDGSDGLQVSYNSIYAQNNLAVKFSTFTEPTWLSIDQSSGTINAGLSDVVTLSFDSSDFVEGTYNKNLVVTSNDPDEASVTIPVALTISSGGTPEILVDTEIIDFGDVEVNSSSSHQINISNPGTGTLIGSILTPEGFSIAAVSKELTMKTKNEKTKKIRETLNFSIGAGNNKDFEVIFEPKLVQTYTGDITISNNAGADKLISVSGTGIPEPVADINVSPNSISSTIDQNETDTTTLTIQNTGDATLTYSANVSYNPPSVKSSKEYCSSSYSDSGSGADDWIANVTFNTINNTTIYEETDSYGDYTSISTEIQQGNTYELCVTLDFEGSFYTQHVRAWIDWDQNESFDTDESFYLGTAPDDGTYQICGDIDVPMDALVGATRLRIIEQYSSDPDDEGACDGSGNHSTQWGETEDYTINVQPAYPTGWITLNSAQSTSGTVNIISSDDITVGFDSSDLDYGAYTADIVITSNDPDEPTTTVAVTLNVSEQTGPTWTPVVYPNNSATLYGYVEINSSDATDGDKVGAFVNSECRAVGDVVINAGTAYITLLINLAANGEEVQFRVWDSSADMIYEAGNIITPNFGEVIGGVGNYYLINAGDIYGQTVENPIENDDPVQYSFDGGVGDPGGNGNTVQIDPPNDGTPDGGDLIVTRLTEAPASIPNPENTLQLWYNIDAAYYTGGYPVTVTFEWDSPIPVGNIDPQLIFSTDNGSTWTFAEPANGVTIVEWDLINTDGDNYSVTFSSDHFSQWIMGDGNESPIDLLCPANVTVTSTATEITLDWEEVQGAESYEVLSSEDPETGFTTDSTGTFDGTSWTCPMIRSTKRFYQVKAIK